MKKVFKHKRLCPFMLKIDLKMKLTVLLVFVTLFQLQAKETYGQKTKISLNLNQVSIEQVFNEIEKQTEFKFLYNYNDANYDKTISIKAKKEQVNTILKRILIGTNVTFKVLGKQIILKKEVKNSSGTLNSTKAKASFSTKIIQDITISGAIVDESGMPLPGVNIIIEGTTTGTQSDFDGEYALKAKKGAVLVFSYVGYKSQKVTVGNSSTINVILKEEAGVLDEVVVIGYGTQKKSNLTAAIATVDTKDLENRPVNTITEMLSASVPGLNITVGSSAPNAVPSINIRGFTGLNSSGAPLVIVDGVPLTNASDIRFVNAQDVENISVLKDAAATAIYGSRAPNGVILVTTKSGKKGQKMKIEFSSDVRISSPLGLPNSLSGSEYAFERNNRRFNSRTGGNGVPLYTDETIERILAYEAGEINTTAIILDSGKYGSVFTFNASENHIQEAFRDNVFNQTYNLSLSGGSDTTTYFASVNALDVDGIYQSDNDWLKRYITNVRINTDIKPWLTVGINSKYSRQETLRPTIWRNGQNDQTLFNSLGFIPTVPAYYDNGTPNEFSIRPNLDGLSGTYSATADIYTTQASIQIKPFKGLTLSGDYTWRATNTFNFNTEFQFGGLDADGTEIPSRRSPNLSTITETSTNINYHTANFNVNYETSLNGHNINAIVGYNQEENNYRQLTASNSDFYTTTVPSLSTTFGDNYFADDRLYAWAVQGYFGRLHYDYKEKYLIDVSGRYDGTSRYSSDDRWVFSPAIAVGYDIAKESFWPLKNAVNHFKLTAKYGRSSNQASTGTSNAQLYTYLPTLGTTGQITTPINGALPSAAYIPPILSDDLTWVKPENIGFGLDVGMFKNKLVLNYEWYQRTVYDQIGVAIQLPEVLGTGVPAQNNAVSETRGFEFSANWRDQFNINGEPFNYGIRVGLSDYIGYVVEYEENETGTRGSWTPGQLFGELYGVGSEGIAQNQDEVLANVIPTTGFYYPGDLFYEDTNGDGLINNGVGSFWYSQGDRKRLGFTYPRYRYNIGLNAEWKSLSLSVLFQGVGHQKVYFANKFNFGTFNFISVEQQERDWWTANDTDAFYPRAYRYNLNQLRENRVNDQYENNLAHLRIKNIGLTYNFKGELLKKMLVSNASITLSGENLGFIFNKSWSKEFDPIQLSTNQIGTYPPSRTFSLGFRLGI